MSNYHCKKITKLYVSPTFDRLAQLVEYRTTMREVVGLNPGGTNSQNL